MEERLAKRLKATPLALSVQATSFVSPLPILQPVPSPLPILLQPDPPGQTITDHPIFIADLIDGTSNFVHGFLDVTVSITVARPVLLSPPREMKELTPRNLWSTTKGHGAHPTTQVSTTATTDHISNNNHTKHFSPNYPFKASSTNGSPYPLLPFSEFQLREVIYHELGYALKELQVNGIPFDDVDIKVSAELSCLVKDEGLYLDASTAFITHPGMVNNDTKGPLLPLKRLILGFSVVQYVIESLLNYRILQLHNYPRHPRQKKVNQETFDKSQAYGRAKAQFSGISGLWGQILNFVFVYFEVMSKLWSWTGDLLLKYAPAPFTG
ncbi:uncharacterized protein Triagg1_6384 [Trichoderma aggressivum f. europaeum]|uniref:CAAX prenyl protease 1 N-terminal domain-containing protein n=1 Tax=Trichoderma aggressivum f. europaeum TaxID=173218 RepID=A0AAE1IAZ2_9HYPO|nr:hypothetical protein Triagg1_6384 [Trichoderma aggressivum f. europaeum]